MTDDQAKSLPLPDPDRPVPAAQGSDLHLRLLATSDLHGHILPWDYYLDAPNPSQGLALTASLIGAARAQSRNSLLVDNGDFLQGSPLSEQAAQQAPGSIHPMIAAMNRLGYDAAALGNHEFSHGLPLLQRAMADATFPILSANLVRALGANPLLDVVFAPPSVILTRVMTDARGKQHRLRIAIIGFSPPQTILWDRAHIGTALTARGILATAAVHVPALRKAGADLVIALCHSGLGPGEADDSAENVATALARLPGLDALVAGHTHLTFPAPAHPGFSGLDPRSGTAFGVPVVLPGLHGSHLGVIDLVLRPAPQGWRIARATPSLRPIAARGPDGLPDALVPSDPGLVAAVGPAHAATRRAAARPVGRLPRRLHSYFALVADNPALRLVAMAQTAHVTARLQGTALQGLPVLSSVAPFKAGGRGGAESYTDVPAGDVALRHAADLYIHPNRIVALRVTGADLANWLEHAAGQFNTLRPGATDAPLLDPDFPSFNFETIHGLTWTFDLSQPPRFDGRGVLRDPQARRVTHLCHRGSPVDPTASFVLATNSYRSGGSGGFAAARDENVIFTGPDTLQHLIVHHIRSGAADLDAPFVPNWGFAPMPGTTARFASSPRALPLLAEVAPLRLDPIGPAEAGFHHYRLHL